MGPSTSFATRRPRTSYTLRFTGPLYFNENWSGTMSFTGFVTLKSGVPALPNSIDWACAGFTDRTQRHAPRKAANFSSKNLESDGALRRSDDLDMTLLSEAAKPG